MGKLSSHLLRKFRSSANDFVVPQDVQLKKKNIHITVPTDTHCNRLLQVYKMLIKLVKNSDKSVTVSSLFMNITISRIIITVVLQCVTNNSILISAKIQSGCCRFFIIILQQSAVCISYTIITQKRYSFDAKRCFYFSSFFSFIKIS